MNEPPSTTPGDLWLRWMPPPETDAHAAVADLWARPCDDKEALRAAVKRLLAAVRRAHDAPERPAVLKGLGAFVGRAAGIGMEVFACLENATTPALPPTAPCDEFDLFRRTSHREEKVLRPHRIATALIAVAPGSVAAQAVLEEYVRWTDASGLGDAVRLAPPGSGAIQALWGVLINIVNMVGPAHDFATVWARTAQRPHPARSTLESARTTLAIARAVNALLSAYGTRDRLGDEHLAIDGPTMATIERAVLTGTAAEETHERAPASLPPPRKM